MKRATKTRRYQMMVDEYNRRHPGPFQMRDVVVWAMSRGLFPVPGRLCSEAEAASDWDARFESLRAETEEP